MTKMFNVALIGCGYWGPNLLRNLLANERCSVRWVCDQEEDRRRYAAKQAPMARTTSRIEDVLGDSSVHGAVVATPAHTHFEVATRLLEAGKHVMVEKPMATSAEEVRKLGELSKRLGLTAMAGHTFIYNPAVRYLKKLIDQGELGEVRYICSKRLNLGRVRSDVDALWNFAPHDVSIIQYLLNDTPPLKVVRSGCDFIQPGIEDVTFLNIQYPDKVMANVHVSWLDPLKVRSMTVVGSDKMVVYDDMSENKIAIYDKGIERHAGKGSAMDFDTQNYYVFTPRYGDILLPNIRFQEPLKIEIEHFVQCIAGETECLTGPEHALHVVSILETS